MAEDNGELYQPTPAVIKQIERQVRVYNLKCAGKSPGEISNELAIPFRTVHTDLQALSNNAKISYDNTMSAQEVADAILATKHKKKGHVPWNKDISLTSKERLDKIVELHKAGYNNAQIASELGLKSSSHISDTLVMLSRDPTNGISFQKRTKETQKWYQAIKHIKDTLLPYYDSRGIKPSLRAAFYRLESDGLINKSEVDYSTLCEYARDARLGKTDKNGNLLYPRLPIDCFADETRDWIQSYDDSDPIDPEDAEDPKEYILRAIEKLKNAPSDWDAEGSEGEVGGKWYNQPEYVEVWIEKFALKPAFEKFLEDWHVNIVVNKGYSSLTFLYHNCERLKKKIERFGPDHVHVLYFGDHDPSGLNIDETIENYFRIFGVPVKVLERVAVTPEQIEEYNIPTRPINPNDTRANGYLKEYGDGAADLDAFLATDDEAFEDLVQQSVSDYYDEDIYDEMVEDYERKPDLWFDEHQRHIEIGRMIQIITEAFKPGWDTEYYESADGGE